MVVILDSSLPLVFSLFSFFRYGGQDRAGQRLAIS